MTISEDMLEWIEFRNDNNRLVFYKDLQYWVKANGYTPDILNKALTKLYEREELITSKYKNKKTYYSVKHFNEEELNNMQERVTL